MTQPTRRASAQLLTIVQAVVDLVTLPAAAFGLIVVLLHALDLVHPAADAWWARPGLLLLVGVGGLLVRTAIGVFAEAEDEGPSRARL